MGWAVQFVLDWIRRGRGVVPVDKLLALGRVVFPTPRVDSEWEGWWARVQGPLGEVVCHFGRLATPEEFAQAERDGEHLVALLSAEAESPVV